MADITEDTILSNPSQLGVFSIFEQAKREADELEKSLHATVESKYLSQTRATTALKGGLAQEESHEDPLINAGIHSVDSYYQFHPMQQNNSVLEHPAFPTARKKQYKSEEERLSRTLETALTTFISLPGKDPEQMAILSRDISDLKKIKAESDKTGQSFADIWFKDADLGKLSFVAQLNLRKEARIYELLMTEGISEAMAVRMVEQEFKADDEKVRFDVEFQKKFGISPEQQLAGFTEAALKDSQWRENAGRLGTLDIKERAERSALAFDLYMLFMTGLPFLGTGLGLYMGVTGNNISLNSADHKLPLWIRALCVIPAIGPLWRSSKYVTKTVSKVFKDGLGPAANEVFKGGAAKAKAAAQYLKDIGKYTEIDTVLRQIDNGEIVVDASEQTLVNILRSVNSSNRGAARAILNSSANTPSPLVEAAKTAIITGDETARLKINHLILGANEEAAKNRTKLLIDAMGGDPMVLDTILRDTRLAGRGTKEAAAVEKVILGHKQKLAKAKQKLADLEKRKAAQAAAKAAKIADEAKVKAEKVEIERRAAEAPSLDDTIASDVKPNVAPVVGNTVKQADGAEARVVHVDEQVVVTASQTGELTVVAKDLLDTAGMERTLAVQERVRELGSYEAVASLYTDSKSLVDRYALLYAEEYYKQGLAKLTPQGQQVATVVRNAKKLKAVRAEFSDIQGQLDSFAGDVRTHDKLESLDNLIAKVEEDVKFHSNSAAHQQRVALLGEMRTYRKQLLEAPSDAPAAVVNNASGQTDASVEAIKAMKAEKAKGVKFFIVDGRSGKARAVTELRPEDIRLNPHDNLVKATPDGKVELVNRGEKATGITPSVIKGVTELDAPAAPKHILRKKPGMQVVMGKDNRPAVFYHGTAGDFLEFDVMLGDLGVHFGDAAQAATRTKDTKGFFKNGANIRPVRLQFKNVIEMPDITFRDPDRIVHELIRMKVASDEETLKLAKFMDSLTGGQDATKRKLNSIREWLKRNGVDGIKYRNMHEGEGWSYLVLDPKESVIPLFAKGK